MMRTRHEMLMQDPEYRRLYAVEGLVTEAAEFVSELMQEQGINKAELARRLGKSRAWVTRLLSGSANMTMRTFAELVYALGAEVEISRKDRPARRDRSVASHVQHFSYKASGTPIGRLRPEFRLRSRNGRSLASAQIGPELGSGMAA